MRDVLIGHRGEPAHWPENSLEGFRQILAAGARYLETDIQISADGVPLLCHDPSLQRMTGHDLTIAATDFDLIRSLPAGAPDDFGERFIGNRIASLAEFVDLLTQWPAAHAFIEIKPAGVQALADKTVVDAVLQEVARAAAQCSLISFDLAVLHQLRARSSLAVGWILPEWSTSSQRLATQAGPEYLFVNRKRLPTPAQPLWPGPWRWVVYTVDGASDIQRFLAQGFDLIETNQIRRLMQEPPGDG
jgi:glycerophosphoryl diester phosphodiesterase